MKCSVVSTPSQSLAYTNRAYVNQTTFDLLCTQAAELGLIITTGMNSDDLALNCWINKAFVLQTSVMKGNVIEDHCVALNGKHRKLGNFTLNQTIELEIFVTNSACAIDSIELGIDLLIKKDNTSSINIDCESLELKFKNIYLNQVYINTQEFAMDFPGSKLNITVLQLNHIVIDGLVKQETYCDCGQVTSATHIKWKKTPGSKAPIILTGQNIGLSRNDDLFKSDFDFISMGIGGLGEQFQKIFRKAFASRIFPGLMKEMGMSHVRGMLLFGPPGCGKTLIARQIGKVLNAREPKIVNGPEILNKFVGGSEEKIRELFVDAEKEQAEMGDNSMLHIIIFDEMDAIMKKRGSSSDSTGVSDSVVNQLLSKIDGVDSLNNILIIGMTNRKDMIDEAIMRPGRLEVQIEISLPDEAGRNQILDIHTNKMKKHGRITRECIEKLPEIANLAMNYTGAELEGLVRSASSFAFTRNVDIKSFKTLDEKTVAVQYTDFLQALSETHPAFGNNNAEAIKSYCRNGIVHWGDRFEEFWNIITRLVIQARTSKWAHLMTILLHGRDGCGKTAIAAKLLTESNYPFVRMISADSMIGLSEQQKCARIHEIFIDSYKSPLSIIFIDEIERIIEFSPIGPRFSNSVLQTLLVLIRKVPPTPESRLLILMTTAVHDSLGMLISSLDTQFSLSIECPELEENIEIINFLKETSKSMLDVEGGDTTNTTISTLSESEYIEIANCCPKPIGCKRLLLGLELARREKDGSIDKEELMMVLMKL